jgi:hypothetical protein
MSSLAPRNSYRNGDELEWVESSDVVDYLPASVWSPDIEEDEITLRSKLVTHYNELMSPSIEREALVETPRQVRILDESQVLSDEALSAASSLNEPSAESVLEPPQSREPIAISKGDDREHPSPAQVRLLDESHVMSGEASFATVLSDQRAKAHSPLSEFLAKTKLSLKQLVLATLALFSVMTLGVIALVSATSSWLGTVSSALPRTTLNTASRSVSTSASTPKSSEPILTSNSPGTVSGKISPTQTKAAAAQTHIADARLSAGSNSTSSRKPTSSDAKVGVVHQETLRAVNPAAERVSSRKEHELEAKKQLDVSRKALKKPEVANTRNASVKSQPREPGVKPGNRQATKQSNVPASVKKAETKKPPTIGAGDRPRTVASKPSP